jgi:ribosomal protein S18 acetylase RimI-like enzyme
MEIMEIRNMYEGDYEAVRALWMRTPGMGLNSLDDSREGIARYLRRNPETCFVAIDDGGLVGVILSGHDGRRGFIYHTAVDAGHRGNGTGKSLVYRALEALRSEGITKVALVVFERNEIGNGFWEHIGFEKRTDLVYRNMLIPGVRMERIDT